MTQKVVTFDSNSAKRIAESVRFTEGMVANQSSGKWHPYRAAGGRMLLCKTTSAWAKGTSQTVDVYRVADQTATGGTVTAINLAADIESGKWCCVQNGMLCWAECEDPPAGA